MSVVLFFASVAHAQTIDPLEINKALNYTTLRNEAYLKMSRNTGSDVSLDTFSRMVSIDKITPEYIYFYVNRQQLDRIIAQNISFETQTPPSLLHRKELKMDSLETYEWNRYPTYDEYLEIMNKFAEKYPDICKVHQFGTTTNGRKLLAIKLSDNVDIDEPEPEFLYVSTIHGDETTGFVLMLHLIDYLTENYETDSRIREMVNEAEIWINPLFNPDGTYFSGNETVLGATRDNANGIDLNRNFPDPVFGDHADGRAWQSETKAMMNFMTEHHFVLSVNFHGGAEVVNYPWDAYQDRHPDDLWYKFISREYADTVHIYSTPDYMTFLDNGTTNGYDWYPIYGGLQDYCGYFQRARHVTIEISDVKLLSESQLVNHWNYNYRSFLNLIDQCRYGIRGFVTDAVTGLPVVALVEIMDHDKKNSAIISSTTSGDFYRPVYEGTYNLQFSAQGYDNLVLYDIDAQNYTSTVLNVKMQTNKTAVPDLKYGDKDFVIRYDSQNKNIEVDFAQETITEGSVLVFALDGRCMYQSDKKMILKGKNTFLISEIQRKGVFIVEVATNNGIFTSKIGIF